MTEDNTNTRSIQHDTVADDQDIQFDKIILNTFHANILLDLEPYLSSLLSTISVNDNSLVSLSVEEAKQFLTKHPNIEDILKEAWEKKTFKEVREIAMLSDKIPAFQPRVTHEIEQAVQNAWNNDYSGSCHLLLLENINRLSFASGPYSNQISIIQSSGTGKSRMVHEQAKFVFTIPFNLRTLEEEKGFAFPKRDGAIVDYLLMTRGLNEFTLRAGYYQFFNSLFVLVSRELDSLKDELSKCSEVEELAQFWRSHFSTIRDEFYGSVIELATKGSKITAENDLEVILKSSAIDALNKLIKQVEQWDKSGKIKIIIYFDESHSLTDRKLEEKDEKTLYDHLCTCLNAFVDISLFNIFLSTNSELVKFATPQSYARSTRIRTGTAVFHPPITETPFDCAPLFKVCPRELTLEMISQISFMGDLGRPLFWNILRAAAKKGIKVEKDMLELAMAKLVASNDYDDSSTVSEMAQMAVLDVQLLIDYEPRREKVALVESKLVASYMRIIYSIPKGYEYMRSGYSSEPLLAEAAAQLLFKWRSKNKDFVVETLTNSLDTGLLDRGELGELTGRQILLDAYHRAVEKEHGQAKPNFSTGCRVTTFIKMLVNDPYAEMVLDSTPDNTPEGKKFRNAFKDSYISFTHFGRMADDTGTTSAVAWVAFVRHMAIICRNGQRNIDFIIPVLLRRTKLCEEVITAIMIQIKRQKTRSTHHKVKIDERDEKFFPLEEKNGTLRPYVSLIMELGVQPPSSGLAETPTQFREPEVSTLTNKREPKRRLAENIFISSYGTPNEPRSQAARERQSVHPRYAFFLYGCTNAVYRGIYKEQEAKYALLLRQGDFLDEHPRKNKNSIQAVRRMKPFWSGGVDSYHWVEYDKTLHGPRIEENLP